MDPSITIYQFYNDQEVVKRLDPDFVHESINNTSAGNNELDLLIELYRSSVHSRAEYVGILPPNFSEVTGISGRRFIDFIKYNPGYDVYFINPFPCNAYISHNIFYDKEASHPGIFGLLQYIFRKAGHDTSLLEKRHREDILLYCSYWVGNSTFWQAYMSLIFDLLDVYQKMSKREKRQYSREIIESNCSTSIFSMIVETTFSYFLSYRTDVNRLAYKYACRDVQYLPNTSALDRSIMKAMYRVISALDRADQDSVIAKKRKKLFQALMHLRGERNMNRGL